MTNEPKSSSSIIWAGRPWITPDVLLRTVSVILPGIAAIWFESYLDVSETSIIGVQFWMWTILLLLLAWLAAIVSLLIIRASHKYILRTDGLEVKTGIASLRTFILAPTGFSDLEINQSLIGRIVNTGNITIRTQGERSACMQKVKDPSGVATLIRENMGKPTVRIEPTRQSNQT